MVIREQINDKLEKHYSDSGLKIKKINEDFLYDDAIDPIHMHVEYEETNIPIEDINDLIDEYEEPGIYN